MTPEELAQRFAEAAFDKRQTMTRVVLLFERLTKHRTPVKRGTLRRSITTRIEGDGDRGVIGTNLTYARYVHDGTRPHLIKPRSAKMLRFKTAGGATVFARAVWHPGTRPQPFFREALRDGYSEAGQILREGGYRLLADIAGG